MGPLARRPMSGVAKHDAAKGIRELILPVTCQIRLGD
jgi:hypothetical protein